MKSRLGQCPTILFSRFPSQTFPFLSCCLPFCSPIFNSPFPYPYKSQILFIFFIFLLLLKLNSVSFFQTTGGFLSDGLERLSDKDFLDAGDSATCRLDWPLQNQCHLPHFSEVILITIRMVLVMLMINITLCDTNVALTDHYKINVTYITFLRWSVWMMDNGNFDRCHICNFSKLLSHNM